MPRPRTHQSSADIDAQIHRLEQERQRLIQAEDQRRGAIIRECLSGPIGEDLRRLLEHVVAPRDAFLFGIQPAPAESKTSASPASKARRSISIAAPAGAASVGTA